MIESVKIDNFRGFKSIEAADLGRINVVVGDNRSGKTAFLEALFLASANNPQSHVKLGIWRGLLEQPVTFTSADVSSGDFWRDLFHGFQQEVPITIQLRGKPHRTLTIRHQERPSALPIAGSDIVAPVTFRWKTGGESYESVPRLTEKEGLVWPNTPPGILAAMLVGQVGAQEAARAFSELDKRNKAGIILESLGQQFPEIEGLSVQLDSSGREMLYALVKGASEKMPLPLISSGVNRLVGILISIARFPSGAVFVDEIENGMYYERLPQLWSTVNQLSETTATQIFVSTHSAEALAALRPVVERSPKAFRLIRTSRNRDGGSTVKVIKGDDLAAALVERVEVR